MRTDLLKLSTSSSDQKVDKGDLSRARAICKWAPEWIDEILDGGGAFAKAFAGGISMPGSARSYSPTPIRSRPSSSAAVQSFKMKKSTVVISRRPAASANGRRNGLTRFSTQAGPSQRRSPSLMGAANRPRRSNRSWIVWRGKRRTSQQRSDRRHRREGVPGPGASPSGPKGFSF